eukprot:COSAG02_NODE_43155_length_377_cov_1.111511_1_plen_58_part_10
MYSPTGAVDEPVEVNGAPSGKTAMERVAMAARQMNDVLARLSLMRDAMGPEERKVALW